MPVVSTTNTLSKLGAHLRWLAEREGVDPERCIVSVGVRGEDGLRKMTDAFARDFDAATMRHDARYPSIYVVHGVPICLVLCVDDKKPSTLLPPPR